MKNRNDKKKICAFILAFLICASWISPSVIPAFATEAEDELEEVIEQQEEAVAERDELEFQLVEKQAEVERLNDLVDQKQDELYSKQVEIDAMIDDITEQRNSIDDRRGGLYSRLRSMYKKGSIGFLDVLFSSSSFLEFLSNLSMLQIIYQNDQDTLEGLEDEYSSLKDSMAKLGAAKAEMEVAQAELESERSDAAYAEAELEDTLESVRAWIEELEAERAELEAIIEEEQKAAAAAGYVYTGGSGAFIWPVSGSISSYYGYRDDALTLAIGGSSFHEGIDIAVPVGTPIYASAPGMVSSATGWSGGYGYLVAIVHGDGCSTLYGHNSSIVVSPGEYVEQGQIIAYSGSTGTSTGPHLHFEIKIGGASVDPLGYL